MATILLLVENAGDRARLAESVGERHEVVDRMPDPDSIDEVAVDLCLIDPGGFRRYRSVLDAKKADEAPVFLPILLLLGPRAPDSPPREVWALVDEVIDTPVDPSELDARVANLLERRRATAELDRRRARTEARFRTLFESTPDPTAVVRSDGVVDAMNDAFVTTFGVSRADAVGTHVENLGGSEATRALASVVDRSAGTGSWPETLELQTVDGERYVAEVNVELVGDRDADADVAGTERVAVFSDVTAREERRERLTRQVDRLERFASVISHDLRDPLNTARAKVRLAQEACESDVLDDLQAVHGRMADIVADVLTLAKRGRAIGDTDPVALGEVVEAAWRTADSGDGATLDVEALPTVRADVERLRALVENLLGNAVRHAAPDATVTVGTLDDAAGFYVADDGPGVPESDRDSVFDYGYTTAEEGTGLGLAIVAEIAEAHGWSVGVTESEAGGARFEVADVGVVTAT